MTAILTYLSGFTAKFWLALCAALLACLPVAYCQGHSDCVSAHKAKVAADALAAADDAAVSAGVAAGEREADTTTIQDEKDRRDAAIDQADDDRPSDASIALSCERMRQAGREVSQFPACRGREGGS